MTLSRAAAVSPASRVLGFSSTCKQRGPAAERQAHGGERRQAAAAVAAGSKLRPACALQWPHRLLTSLASLSTAIVLQEGGSEQHCAGGGAGTGWVCR